VTDLMLFRQDTDGRDVELRGSTVALEVELQRRVEAGMEPKLSIRFLASEYPTGPWHRGRIDKLGLDENNTPVMIEFKKGADAGVLSQSVSYLAWLDSARHEFEALVKEKLGADAAESIDWRNPRMVCIAAGFSHHDRVAVHRLHERIDLVRYRIFDGGLLGLVLVESAPGSPRPVLARRQRQKCKGAGAGGRWDAADTEAPRHHSALPARPVCRVGRGPHRMGRDRGADAATPCRLPADGEPHSVIFRPAHEVILLYLTLDPDTAKLEEGFTRDMRGIEHLGTGDLEVRIASAADLDRAAPLIQRDFEAA
jgi:hypothetical protein